MDNEKILAELKRKGADELLPMLKTGQVTLLLEENRKVKGIMSAALVDSTEDNAWKTLLDYDGYQRFLPGINVSKVLSRKENEIVVKFEAGIKVMGIGGTVRYTYRMSVARPFVNVYDAKSGGMSGYWAILPTGDPNRIILAHGDVAKDVRSIHIFLRFLVERLPTAELGLHLAPVAMMVNRVKLRIEQLHRESR
ncbi:MAG: hypothetical protein AB1742_13235 [bacterium]